MTGQTKIWRRNAADLGPLGAGAGGPFDLAFLDAPYRKGLTDKTLIGLAAGGWLTPRALVIAEMAEDETTEAPPEFTLLDSRSYGETRLQTYGVSPG